MKNLKANSVNLAGNIAQVNIQNGQHGPFGSVSIAADDGYYKKGQNGQQGEWIDRTHFIEVNMNSKSLQSLKQTLNIGDQLSIEGKLVVEKWQDSQTSQNRNATKVECLKIVGHIPKSVIDAAKQAGVIQTGQNQNQSQASQPQRNGSNGYMNAPVGNQNRAPNRSQGNGYQQQGYQQ